MESTWYLYILKCADDTLYTGITTDVPHRLEMHSQGRGAKYTRGRGPLELIYREVCGSHSHALKREYRVKQLTRQEKLKLAEKGENPMVYYQDKDILIRNILPADAQTLCDEEIAQGWDATVDKYHRRLADQESGKAICMVAEYRGQPAGYINVYPDCQWGAFGGQGLCEIIDFGVLEKYRRRGIGSKLMDTAEEIAGQYADIVYLGVGLHSGYGAAQRMYVKRGYIPDGSGVWYGKAAAEPYRDYCNDDELNLYFSKKLK